MHHAPCTMHHAPCTIHHTFSRLDALDGRLRHRGWRAAVHPGEDGKAGKGASRCTRFPRVRHGAPRLPGVRHGAPRLPGVRHGAQGCQGCVTVHKAARCESR
eukprot:365975-Chlamydomonas_euryale.AAC.12